MKMIRLERQKTHRIDELYKMRTQLKDFLDEDVSLDDRDWNRNLNAIIDFQDADGSFKLLDSKRIPSDARVDFCHMPTYISSAILMKAYMTDPSAFTLREKSALSKGLKMSCARNLRGHGYEALKGQIEALNIFMKAGLREFIDLHPDLCPEFTQMIGDIIARFDDMEFQKRFTGPWGESYENDIKSVNEYFSNRMVFVYGTLMSGEANHRYLEDGTCIGKAAIKGYDMYDVGWYPAIVPGDGLIVGELYRVSKFDMPAIDSLEGEGSLYIKRCEWITLNGDTHLAFVYIYNRDVSGLERIPAWKEYVWYVSYGSNMLTERFLCYIQGGAFEGSRPHPACEDTTLPLAIIPVEIPYDMYFANESGSWGGGVSFLDITRNGRALGVAYLITKEQFEHVSIRENSGRPPMEGYGWYEDIIDLEPIDGIEAKTITNRNLRDYNVPRKAYLDTLRRGIRQNWPDMTDEEIEDYLYGCIR